MRLRFITPILFLIVAAVLAGGRVAGWRTSVGPRHAHQMSVQEEMAVQGEVTTRNSTKSLVVLSAHRNRGYVELTLRNDYDRPISAFVITPSAGSHYIIVNLRGGEPISPGGTHIQRLVTPDAVLTISAVVFNDLTGDGEPKFIEEIVEEHKGEVLQRHRIHELLKPVLDAPDFDIAHELAAARELIAALPETISGKTPDTDRGRWFSDGLRNAKTAELREIDSWQSTHTLHSGQTDRRFVQFNIEHNKRALADLSEKERLQ